jgi:hypothetical protein
MHAIVYTHARVTSGVKGSMRRKDMNVRASILRTYAHLRPILLVFMRIGTFQLRKLCS